MAHLRSARRRFCWVLGGVGAFSPKQYGLRHDISASQCCRVFAVAYSGWAKWDNRFLALVSKRLGCTSALSASVYAGSCNWARVLSVTSEIFGVRVCCGRASFEYCDAIRGASAYRRLREHLTIGSSDRGRRLRWAKEGVDDLDQVPSFCVGEAPRRSTLLLDPRYGSPRASIRNTASLGGRDLDCGSCPLAGRPRLYGASQAHASCDGVRTGRAPPRRGLVATCCDIQPYVFYLQLRHVLFLA
jgi:hypothetical protein